MKCRQLIISDGWSPEVQTDLTSQVCTMLSVQDPEGHSLWDLTWYKAHSISANLTPTLLADSGLAPSVLEPQARLPREPQNEHSLSNAPEENLAQSAEALPVNEGMQPRRRLACGYCSKADL